MATEAEVAACWPGGDENPARGYDGWIECYALFKGFARRQEQRDTGGQRDGQTLRAELAQAMNRAAARGTIPVQLSVGAREVYPKSLWALWFLQSLDAVVGCTKLVASELAALAPAVEVWGLPALTQGLAWRTWAWILTYDGVGLPFEDAAAIEPPAWTAELLPEDYVALYVAHRALHLTDSSVLAGAFPAEGGEKSRMDLGGFVSAYAAEHGLRASVIIRQWSLPEFYAAAIGAAESHRVATANAEQRRKERP